MDDETGAKLEGVMPDDPEAPDEDAPRTAADYAALFREHGIPVKGPQAPAAEADADEGEADAEDEAGGEVEDDGAEAGEESPAPKTDTQAAKPPEKPADKSKERTFTQDEVNAIIAERIARDRKAQEMRELEAVAGKDVSALIAEMRQGKAMKMADEYGMTEAEAQSIVEAQETAARLKAENEELKAKEQAAQREAAYRAQKAQFAANPNVLRYEAEIDRFAREHSNWDFRVAALAVLGQKVIDGTLQEAVATATRQKTLADVARRKVGAEAPRSAGAAPDVTLPAETRQYADQFARVVPGLTRQGVAKQYDQLKRGRRR